MLTVPIREPASRPLWLCELVYRDLSLERILKTKRFQENDEI
jgi:hypothetical protein